jgi:hypothetical protein
MITIIALVIQVLISLVSPTHADVVVIPERPSYSPTDFSCGEYVCNCYENNCDASCGCWVCYEDEAYDEYKAEFTALFNSYTYKLSRNGRSMINGKFVAMGAK